MIGKAITFAGADVVGAVAIVHAIDDPVEE